MAVWKNDEELFSLAKKELFVALVGDVLDRTGFRRQFLPQSIKPLCAGSTVIGRAMPVLEADVFDEVAEDGNNPLMKKPFGIMFEALDSLKENEVYVCSGASPGYALWGGLMSVRAQKLKAAGAVVNGFSRDTNEILNMNFPVFSMGSYAQDQGPRGKVIDYGSSIEFGGIRIHPGDIVYGDRDGTLVVPQQVAEEAFALAIEKARGEKSVRKALEDGMSAADAFEKYGIM
ncbi:MAG: RraA family protein [Tannerella sp.]|jgi:regulator of RNase E activity RraA|nr:RraA family protein [Tannerella sp.]